MAEFSTMLKTHLELINVPQFTEVYCHRSDDVELKVRRKLLKTCNNPERGWFYLVGEDGVGKTTLLSHLLRSIASNETGDDYLIMPTVVLWMNCSKIQMEGSCCPDTVNALSNELINVAKLYDQTFSGSSVADIVSFFCKMDKHVLFVFDDVFNLGLFHCIDQLKWCSCILVCQPAVCEPYWVTRKITLESLTEDQIYDMLQNFSGMERQLSADQLKSLAAYCCGLPLIASLVKSCSDFNFTSWISLLSQFNNLDEIQRKKNTIIRLFKLLIENFPGIEAYCYAFLFFEPGDAVSVRDVAIFWSPANSDAVQIVSRLQALSLCHVSAPSGQQLLHHRLLYEVTLQIATDQFSLEGSAKERLEQVRLRMMRGQLGMPSLFDPALASDHVRRLAINYAAKCGQLDLVEMLVNTDKTLTTTADSMGWTPTLLAAQHGHLNVLKFVIENDRTAILQTKSGRKTAVMFAAEHGHLDIVEFLTRNTPATLSQTNENGVTALMLAAKGGRLEVVKFIVDNCRSSIFDSDRDGMTALLYGAQDGHLMVVEFLSKVEPRTMSHSENSGKTAIILAAENGHLDIVHFATKIDRQSVTKGTKEGQTPIMFASQYGHLEVVQFLAVIDEATIRQSNHSGMTALLFAAEYGHLDILKLLVALDLTTLRQRAVGGVTAVLLAAAKGYINIVKYICEIDRELVLQRDNDGTSVTLYAAQRGHLDVVRFAVEIDRSVVSQPDDSGRTPLLAAAKNGQLETLKFILSIDESSLSHADQMGTTALILATANGHLETVRHISEVDNTTISQTHRNGRTALMFASRNGQLEIAKLISTLDRGQLPQSDSDGKSALIFAAEEGRFGVAQFIVENDARTIYHADNNGMTAILHAAKCSSGDAHETETAYFEIVKLILETDPGVISQTENGGMTALMLAAASGMLEIVQLIASYDRTTLLQTDHRGLTPIMHSAKNGHLDVFMFLASLDPTTVLKTDNYGVTPLMYAAWSGMLFAVRYIAQLDPKELLKSDNDGKTVMMYAFPQSCLHVVKFLSTQNQETVTKCDSFGRSPLMYSAAHGFAHLFETLKPSSHRHQFVDICEILINAGADLDALDNEGNSSLIHAVTASVDENVTRLLLEQSFSSFDSRNQQGNSAANIVYGKLVDNDNNNKAEYINAFLNFLRAGATLYPDPLENNQSFLTDSWDTRWSLICDIVIEMRRKGSIDWRVFGQEDSSDTSSLRGNFLRKRFPRSLQAIARSAILEMLPFGIKLRSAAISELRLPNILEKFLNFEELSYFGVK